MKTGWKPILGAVLALFAFDAGAAKQVDIVRAYQAGIDLADIAIALERTGCLGNCPTYRVTISGSGRVAYEGKQLVKEQGTREGRLEEDEVLKLINAILLVRFFDADDRYEGRDGITRSGGKYYLGRAVTTDMSSAIVTVRMGDYRKTVVLYEGYPRELGDIPKLIDDTVDIERWIGAYCDRPRGQFPLYSECDEK